MLTGCTLEENNEIDQFQSPEGARNDEIFTLVVTNVCSDDENVVFCFSMLECPLMVVERCVTENSTEQSEEKAAKKD